jgi:hypothetical protein
LFELVDRDHKPVVGARLVVRLFGDATGWGLDPVTDESGKARVRGNFGDDLCVGAYSPEQGYMPSQRIKVDPDSNEAIRLVLDGSLHLKVRALEGGKPAAGIAVWVVDGCGIQLGSAPSITAADGTVSWKQLGAGKYSIAVRQEGYWRMDTSVDFSADSGTFDIPVRGLGGLSFEAKNEYDSPLRGARIDLASKTDECAVATWVSAGRVPAPSNGGSTDERGRVEFAGLPAGEYHWTVTSAEGATKEGDVQVLPRANMPVAVRVP